MCCLYVWEALSAGVGASGFGRVGFCVCHFCFETKSKEKNPPANGLFLLAGDYGLLISLTLHLCF